MYENKFRPFRRCLRTICGLGLLIVGSSGIAHATCMSPSAPARTAGEGGFAPAVFHPDSGRGFSLMNVSFQERPSIVGLWKFEMLAKSTPDNKNPMPDGALVDFGTTAWHGDGNEIMNSGSRNPADGDFCLGVWDQVGPATYVLSHFPIAWANGAYLGPVRLRVRVNLDRSGMHFAGVFKLTQYLATLTPGHEFDETTPLVTVTGTITATRLTAD
jgi:hypothetical protein